MRPRLKDDVRYLPLADGVYLHSDLSSFTLPGKQTYTWIERLAPFLTGEHELDELTSTLSDKHRYIVERLVETLYERGLIADARADEPHSLTDAELRTYAEEIAFIRYSLDSAEHRFQRYRERPVVLAGDGPVMVEILRAGLRSGWRQTSILVGSGDTARLKHIAWESRRDANQRVDVTDIVTDGDLVLQVVTHDDPALLEMPRVASLLGQVLVDECGGVAWIGPVGPPATTRTELAWRRLLTRQRGSASAKDWLTGPVPALVAAQLVLACFRHLTGLDNLPRPGGQTSEPLLTRLDLCTLDTTSHHFSPRPSATDLLTRARSFVDEHVGLIRQLDEENLTQLPLWVCRARVSGTCAVIGCGEDRDEARLRAVLAACVAYGALGFQPDGTMHGTDLATGEIVAASTPSVFPASRPVGTAAGLTWNDAVQAGLRQHCEALLAQHDFRSFRRVHLADEVGEGRAARLLRMFEATGEHVSAHDLTDVIGVPAFGFDGGIVACGATTTEALAHGLERVLLRWQLGDQPAPDGLPDGGGHDLFVNALLAAGHSPVVVPLNHNPELVQLLPHVVRVLLQ